MRLSWALRDARLGERLVRPSGYELWCDDRRGSRDMFSPYWWRGSRSIFVSFDVDDGQGWVSPDIGAYADISGASSATEVIGEDIAILSRHSFVENHNLQDAYYKVSVVN